MKIECEPKEIATLVLETQGRQKEECKHRFSRVAGSYDEEACIYCGKTKKANEDMKFTLKRWIE